MPISALVLGLPVGTEILDLIDILVDSIKKEVMIMGHKLNSLQMDIKTVLEELKTIQRTPTPRTSTEECHTYLVINEKKENL